jgi:hypothetical protein
MKRFVEGECRDQSVLFPERLDEWIAEDNPVRAVDGESQQDWWATAGDGSINAALAPSARPDPCQ